MKLLAFPTNKPTNHPQTNDSNSKYDEDWTSLVKQAIAYRAASA
jgi:hypothetical protein